MVAEFVLYSVDFYTFDVHPLVRYVVEGGPSLCDVVADVLVHQLMVHPERECGADAVVVDMYPPSTRLKMMATSAGDVLTNDCERIADRLRLLAASSVSIMVNAPESEHYFLLCTLPSSILPPHVDRRSYPQ